MEGRGLDNSGTSGAGHHLTAASRGDGARKLHMAEGGTKVGRTNCGRGEFGITEQSGVTTFAKCEDGEEAGRNWAVKGGAREREREGGR